MKRFDPRYKNYFVHHFVKFLKKNKAYDGWSEAILDRHSGPEEVFGSYSYIHWIGSTFRWLDFSLTGEKTKIFTRQAEDNFRSWEALNNKWINLTSELAKENIEDDN